MDILGIIVACLAVAFVIFTISYNLRKLIKGEKSCACSGCGNCHGKSKDKKNS